MRCNLRTVYGPKSAFTICTDRTDRQTLQDCIRTKNCLFDPYRNRKAVFSDRISLSILDMSETKKRMLTNLHANNANSLGPVYMEKSCPG